MYLIKKKFVPIVFAMDLIGNILFFWTKLKHRPDNVKKVLFIRLEHIGDMIMATPAFENFKKSNPKCELHVLCKNLTAPLIKNNPNVDKIITYDAPWFNARIEDSKKSFFDIVRELRKEGYDLIFEMHGDPRNNLFAFLAGGYCVGYSCRGAGFLLNKTEEYNPNIHMIKQNLGLIEDFARIKIEETKIFTDKTAKKQAEQIMRKNKIQTKKFIIINPISGRKEKDLTDSQVLGFIKKNEKTKIIITGSSSKIEVENNKKFVEYENVVDLTGKTNILTLVELVRHASLVIAPDTGIIHVAKAVNTKFNAIYKTTDKKIWGY